MHHSLQLLFSQVLTLQVFSHRFAAGAQVTALSLGVPVVHSLSTHPVQAALGLAHRLGLRDPGSILCLPGLSAGEDGGAPLPWGCTPLPLAAGPLPWCTEPVASQSCSFWSFSVLVRKEFLPTPSLFHCSNRPPLVMFWPAIGWSVEACV